MQGMKKVHSTEHGSLYQGDCLELLAAQPDDSVAVVFADPPFNLGKDYGTTHHGNRISDDMRDLEYVDWCAKWVKECARVLAPGGAIWLYNLPKWNIDIGHQLNELGLMFRHWVAVDIKMLLPIPARLYPSHYSLLYYTNGKPRVFDRPRIPIPVCRHCGGDIRDYGGHRNKLNPQGLNLTDVWTDIPPVRHARTKTRAANQLSEKMLERVLSISSVEADLVLDPFGGSGTTYVVAERMHRNWIGIELGDTKPIIERLRGESTYVHRPRNGDSGKGMTSARKLRLTTEEPSRLFPS
jgi:site-specific DNA-methyltransferase (adenine-specific)